MLICQSLARVYKWKQYKYVPCVLLSISPLCWFAGNLAVLQTIRGKKVIFGEYSSIIFFEGAFSSLTQLRLVHALRGQSPQAPNLSVVNAVDCENHGAGEMAGWLTALL